MLCFLPSNYFSRHSTVRLRFTLADKRDSQFGSELNSPCFPSSASSPCVLADKSFRRENRIVRQRRKSLPPKKWRTSRPRTPACGRQARPPVQNCPASVFQRAVDNFRIPHVFHAGHPISSYLIPPHNGPPSFHSGR
jgi:hypothetical protein